MLPTGQTSIGGDAFSIISVITDITGGSSIGAGTNPQGAGSGSRCTSSMLKNPDDVKSCFKKFKQMNLWA
jgi:hypothetical protein